TEHQVLFTVPIYIDNGATRKPLREIRYGIRQVCCGNIGEISLAIIDQQLRRFLSNAPHVQIDRAVPIEIPSRNAMIKVDSIWHSGCQFIYQLAARMLHQQQVVSSRKRNRIWTEISNEEVR